MLIFRNSRSQIFFKIGVLKNFAIFTGIHWSPSFTEHMRWLLLDFRDSKYFFSAESGIYCWQPHRFLLRTSLKTGVKPQKQPSELLCKKRCSWKFCKFHRKTPVSKSLFNRVAGLKGCSFIKTRLQHRCFPVEFTKFLRTSNLRSVNDCFWNLFLHLDCAF